MSDVNDIIIDKPCWVRSSHSAITLCYHCNWHHYLLTKYIKDIQIRFSVLQYVRSNEINRIWLKIRKKMTTCTQSYRTFPDYWQAYKDLELVMVTIPFWCTQLLPPPKKKGNNHHYQSKIFVCNRGLLIWLWTGSSSFFFFNFSYMVISEEVGGERVNRASWPLFAFFL